MKNLVRIKIIFCLIIIIAFQDIAQVRDLDREILDLPPKKRSNS